MAIQGSYGTELDVMQQAARRVDEVANAIDGELRALDNRIQPITSSWRGAAASAYMNLHQRWTDDANKLRATLAEISETVKRNAISYQLAEDENSSQAARIAGSL